MNHDGIFIIIVVFSQNALRLVSVTIIFDHFDINYIQTTDNSCLVLSILYRLLLDKRGNMEESYQFSESLVSLVL